MDILVTFPDGTTELRAANSPAGSDVYGWPPAATYETDACDRGWYIAGDLYPELVDWRGDRDAHVWRITGQDAVTKALTGEWQSCTVETVDEQIARLTRERDAAEKRAARWKRLAKHLRFVLAGAEQDIAHLRRGAVAMIAALSDEGTDVKPSSLAASLVVWAEHVREQRGQLEAAEKRIADLRAWAEQEAGEWDATADILDVSSGGTAWHLVVAKIDGKAG